MNSFEQFTGAPAFLLLLLLFTSPSLLVTASQKHHRLQLYEQYDALVVARCDARCWTDKTSKHQCVKQCLMTGANKPGDCPRQDALSLFDSVCLEACGVDSQCPEVTKCCRHRCGVTCQAATGLEHIAGIPRIPTEVSVSERRRGRTLYIRWKGSGNDITSGPVIYVLEERHHAGRHFTESRLGAWTPRHRSAKPTALLKNLVKPGRWYQFRVAAVNENGTRGYSEHSMRFITSLGPRPPAAPPNMTVGPLRSSNGTLSGELRWDSPTSDLPIQRYKVFWSRRLHGATALNSVLVQHQTVSKDENKFDLKNLQPNSLYFLQVQALAQFGKERLKGEKSALVLNTTNHKNDTDSTGAMAALTDEGAPDKNQRSGKSGQIEGLHVQRIFWARDKLLARVAWKMRKPSVKYTVTWWPASCKNSSGSSHMQLAATTKATHFNIYNLNFECKYHLTVKSDAFGVLYESSLNFSTVSCGELSRLHKDKPNCALQ